MLLYFSSQSPYFAISLFNKSVQPFTLLSKGFHAVFAINSESLVLSFKLCNLFAVFFSLSDHCFVFCSQPSNLSCRKSQVLLGSPYLLVKASVFGKQFLNPLLICLRFLACIGCSAFQLIQFASKLGKLGS